MDTVKAETHVVTLSDSESLAKKTLDIFVDDFRKLAEPQRYFRMAISGGDTPRHFFDLLADSASSHSLPWDKIQLFWVDERCVPMDSPASNYKLAVDTFLGNVGIPAENVHRIYGESIDWKVAAVQYEQTIRRVFGLKKGELPRFDLVVLGMGADGHTGSLFRDSYATFDKEDLACVVYSMGGDYSRITMTHPVLCAASHVLILVSGEEKAQILKEVLTAEPDAVKYPIHTLWPILDKVTWLVDKDAAKLL